MFTCAAASLAHASPLVIVKRFWTGVRLLGRLHNRRFCE